MIESHLQLRNALRSERDVIKKFVCEAHIDKSGYNDQAIQVQLEDNPSLCWVLTEKSFIDSVDGIVGCTGVRVDSNDSVNLVFLYVSSSHRGKGFGRQLLRTAISWSKCSYNIDDKNFQFMSLYTLKDIMTSAISLYCSEGFQIVEEKHVTCFCVLTMKLDL